MGCIFSNLGPWSLIAQSVVGITLQLLILLFSVGKFPRFEIHLSLFKETAKFGSMMTLRRLSWDALVRMTPIAANIVGGPSMAGIVGFSWRIVELIRGSISSGLGAYLLPLIARDKNNKPKMANDFLNITNSSMYNDLIAAGAFSVAYDEMVSGEKLAPLPPIVKSLFE